MAPLQILGTEWIIVIIVVLILIFGSKKVPELARSLGKAMGEFQKGRAQIEGEIRAASQAIQAPINETAQALRETQAQIEGEIRAASQAIQAPINEATSSKPIVTPKSKTHEDVQSYPSLQPQTHPTTPPPSLDTEAEESAPPPSERERLEMVARDLGISIEGKTDEQLKEEIRKAMF